MRILSPHKTGCCVTWEGSGRCRLAHLSSGMDQVVVAAVASAVIAVVMICLCQTVNM